MERIFSGQSTYCHVDITRDNDIVTLKLDDMVSSAVNVANPLDLPFTYMSIMHRLIQREGALNVMHLGGGGLALARAIATSNPGSRQVAVEYDGALIDIVRTHMPVDKRQKVRMRHQDAATAIATCPPHRYDFIIRDVFASRDGTYGYTPENCASATAYAAMVRGLKNGGLVLVNINMAQGHKDVGGVTYGRRDLAGALEATPYCMGFRSRGDHKKDAYNLVVALGDQPLKNTIAAGLPSTIQVLKSRELTNIVAGARPLVGHDGEPQVQ